MVKCDSWDINRVSHFHSHDLGTTAWMRWFWCCLVVISRRWVKANVFGAVMVALVHHVYQVGMYTPASLVKFKASSLCDKTIRHRALHRFNVWQTVCKDPYFRLSKQKGVRNVMYTDRNKRLAFCSVPEVADTFWKGVIRYVNNASKTIRGIAVDIPRWQTYFLEQTSTEDQPATAIRFLFSEDPYIRLWKIWVEKYYLTGFWFKSFHDAKVLTQKCQSNMTFANFLRLITMKKYLDHPEQLNVYWRPQVLLCDICSLDPSFVGKMETFEADTRCILHMSNYSWALINQAKRGLGSLSNLALSMAPLKYRQWSQRRIRVLVQENFARWKAIPAARACVSFPDLVKKLWTAFQYLGYLPASAKVPNALLGRNEMKVETFLLESLYASLTWPGTNLQEPPAPQRAGRSAR
ncbi:hypothetical protein RRG08_058431 [Elysia crispata]|uniref:Carbohydrate sulfotransferase n=1 Tax=Elysia crispata TaxID=231223 RepID=A0AAE1DWF6_9GAST|nr:hypothetical protein RRG08_058431 [Elysia crispata]